MDQHRESENKSKFWIIVCSKLELLNRPKTNTHRYTQFYTQIHTQIYTHRDEYTQLYKICTHTATHTDTYIAIHIDTHTAAHIQIHTAIHTDTHRYIYTDTHRYAHTQTHVCPCMREHTHTVALIHGDYILITVHLWTQYEAICNQPSLKVSWVHFRDSKKKKKTTHLHMYTLALGILKF